MAAKADLIEANTEVSRLFAAAAVVRRYSGELKYHPTKGLQSPVDSEFLEAIQGLRDSVSRVDGWRSRFSEEEAALGGRAAAAMIEEVRAAHKRIQTLIGLLRAALEILSGALAQPERARLDAPYGLGAPRRVHPGAQATWVGERADGLARELGYVTVLKANLLLLQRPER
jgi:hypothetical protein